MSMLWGILVLVLSTTSAFKLLNAHRGWPRYLRPAAALSTRAAASNTAPATVAPVVQDHVVVTPSMKEVVTTREEQNDGGLTPAQRLSRAVDFYKDAVPVLVAYLVLGKQLQFEREVLQRTVSKADEGRRYDALHEWGSVRITDAITRLQGFYVKTGQVTLIECVRYLCKPVP